MRKTIFFCLLALAGCKAPEKGTPVGANFVKDFNQSYSEGMVKYGAVTVDGQRQNITSIDCMVFTQAAKSPLPNNLGESAAYTESLRRSALIGCVPSVVEGLTLYETARRHTRDLWESTKNTQIPSVQLVLSESSAGKILQDQIKEVAHEQMACRAEFALALRKSNITGTTLDRSLMKCRPELFSAANNDTTCSYSWETANAVARAQGKRDTQAYMSELLARYHNMFLFCTPQSATEYVAFHQTVPAEIFQTIGYRFKVPIDPIMSCHLQEMAKRRSNKNGAVRVMHSYLGCAKNFNLANLYSGSPQSAVFDAQYLRGEGDITWIYDPTQTTQNPARWSLNECQKQMIGYLSKNGFNIVEPEGLKYYCERVER